jgi:hypothetical protein
MFNNFCPLHVGRRKSKWQAKPVGSPRRVRFPMRPPPRRSDCKSQIGQSALLSHATFFFFVCDEFIALSKFSLLQAVVEFRYCRENNSPIFLLGCACSDFQAQCLTQEKSFSTSVVKPELGPTPVRAWIWIVCEMHMNSLVWMPFFFSLSLSLSQVTIIRKLDHILPFPDLEHQGTLPGWDSFDIFLKCILNVSFLKHKYFLGLSN